MGSLIFGLRGRRGLEGLVQNLLAGVNLEVLEERPKRVLRLCDKILVAHQMGYLTAIAEMPAHLQSLIPKASHEFLVRTGVLASKRGVTALFIECENGAD